MKKHVLMAATALALLPVTSFAQNYMGPTTENRVFVNGNAEIEVVPDMVTMSFTSVGRHEDAKQADAKMRFAAEAVRNAVLQTGVNEEDLTTSRVRLTPVFSYEDNQPPKVRGYESSLTLTVTSKDVNIAGPVMNAAVEAGATEVSGPHFEVSDPNEAIFEAKSAAMENAIDNAQALADAGGFELGDIITVTDSGQSHMPKAEMATMRMMSADMAPGAPETVIDAGQQTVSASVAVVFEIGDSEYGEPQVAPWNDKRPKKSINPRDFERLDPMRDSDEGKEDKFHKTLEEILIDKGVLDDITGSIKNEMKRSLNQDGNANNDVLNSILEKGIVDDVNELFKDEIRTDKNKPTE